MSEKKENSNMRGPMGGGHGLRKIEKAHNFKGTMKKLLRYLKPFRASIIVVLLFSVCSTLFSIIGPKILGEATTTIFNGLVGKVSGTGTGIDFNAILVIALTLLGLYLLSALFTFLQGFFMTGVSQKVSYNMRRDISKKMSRLPLKYFETKTHGEILSRVTNDVDTVSQSLSQSLSQIITSAVTMVGVLVMMLVISPLMTVAAVILLPLTMVLISLLIKRSQKYFIQQQAYLGHVNGHVEELYGGHTIMQAFNGEQKAEEQFDELNGKLYESAWKSQFLSGVMQPVTAFVGNLGYVLVSILGGWLAVMKTIAVGDILSFIQYIRLFTQPVTQLAQISNVLQSTAAAAERVFEFLEEPEEAPDAAEPVHTDTPSVSFEHVRFGYTPEKMVIRDFCADVKPGQRVAIVGPTGAGKTTLVKLLMRFYDVDAGAVKVGGEDIREFSRDELRGMFGMVLQDTWLFHGTIMENIRYGRLNATDAEVIAAAKAARADRFIRTLPDGYNMVLDEEAGNVSQGQKQLLTIARAILADPKILILDEATSSVDTRTEALIQKAMESLMQGRTSFVIAHRLSTIRDADVIFVMQDGDIVEQGTHEELLAANGFYAELYKSQFEAA